MDLPSLISGVDHPPELGQEIVRLVDRKACGGERDTIDRISHLDTFIRRNPEPHVNTRGGTARRDLTARADAFLASIAYGARHRLTANRRPSLEPEFSCS
jgi:hypothetical protein